MESLSQEVKAHLGGLRPDRGVACQSLDTLTPSPWGSVGLPSGKAVKNRPADAGDTGAVPELGRSPGEGSGCQSQYSCLENPTDVEFHGEL